MTSRCAVPDELGPSQIATRVNASSEILFAAREQPRELASPARSNRHTDLCRMAPGPLRVASTACSNSYGVTAKRPSSSERHSLTPRPSLEHPTRNLLHAGLRSQITAGPGWTKLALVPSQTNGVGLQSTALHGSAKKAPH